MQLLTDKIKEVLPPLYSTEGIKCEDKEIIVRFFNPVGNQTWEIVEGEKEPDGEWLFFAKCDLGFGTPEWGYVTLSQLEEIKLPMGMRIERDICVGPSELHPEWS